jgi:hypothetical protein
MRISRRTGVLVSSVVAAAAIGVAGGARAAIAGGPAAARPTGALSASASASHSLATPPGIASDASADAPSRSSAAADSVARSAQLKGFATVREVLATVQQAGSPHADPARVRAAADQAKRDLDALLRQAKAEPQRPGAARQPVRLLAQSDAQLKSALDKVVSADRSQDPADLLGGLTDLIQALLNLLTSLLGGAL